MRNRIAYLIDCMIISNINKNNPVIAWWSGGVPSAVTSRLCIDSFGIENVQIVFIDTKNEDEDTYRFKKECEEWYKKEIITITNNQYEDIEQVWEEYLSLNTANGAICSTHLKRLVRENFQKQASFSYQAFGYTIETTEIERAKGLKANHPDCRPIFPLISQLLTKKDCIKMVQKANDLFLAIEIPKSYKSGYGNNNCWKRGCVRSGVGYWQKIRREQPDKFDRMALVQHRLTDLKREPVTMLKDQSRGGGLCFLKPHASYPNIKDISMMTGREPKPMMDCNGFCGTDDLVKNKTEKELAYSES